jgi:DNA-binding protein HU-alpha
MTDNEHDSTAAETEATARKARGARAARKGKAAASAATSGAEGAETAAPVTRVAAYKTHDLVDRVSKVAGIKRRAAKPLVETVLAELGAVLGEGRPMSLGALGKITVARTREAGGGQVLVCRIRQKGRKGDAGPVVGVDEALAEAGEGS